MYQALKSLLSDKKLVLLIIGLIAVPMLSLAYIFAQDVIAEGLNAREVKQVEGYIREVQVKYAEFDTEKAVLYKKLEEIRLRQVDLHRKANAWRDYIDYLSGKN